ncbi:unnamed protein product [Auanema sp. JU1783]|nr:unnamed protein product [Auanema sp. JU1783]
MALDIKEMVRNLHRMRLELERSLNNENDLLIRNGSIVGRKLHVYNTIRSLRHKALMMRDYIAEEEDKVIVYITTCGIFRAVWDRCQQAVTLLRALNIKVEVRDLNLDPSYVPELLERMQLLPDDRDLVFDNLPTIYVNGKYFGNDETLFLSNEKKELSALLRDFQGRNNCSTCNGAGYIVCSKCSGSKKASGDAFSVRLKCASCDQNGIAPCQYCTPRALKQM